VLTTSGFLTNEGELAPNLLRAKCECGWTTILPADLWGEQFGCTASCHDRWLKRLQTIEDDARREAEAAAEKERQEAERLEKFQLNVVPEFPSLAPPQKRLFRLLAGYPSFTLNTVRHLLHTESWDLAWDALRPLLSAKTLFELRDNFEPRPYSLNEPYLLGCWRESHYRVRESAVRQMREEEERLTPTAPEPAASEPASVELGGLPSGLGQFIDERCVVDPAASHLDPLLRSAYVNYVLAHGQPEISVEEWNRALAEMGYELDENRRRRKGLRLRTRSEMKPAQEVQVA
jgi:hypothetical protein